MKPGGLEIVHALGLMDQVERPDQLEFDKTEFLTNRSAVYPPTATPFVMDPDVMLLLDPQPAPRSSWTRAFLYTFSRNPTPTVFRTTNERPMIFSERRVRGSLSV